MPGILDPYLKLGRAKVHLDALNIEIETFGKTQPCTIERYDDLENRRHVLRFDLKVVPDPPCLIAGDALYCMRSALDQLLWSLSKLTLKIPPTTVQFPVCAHIPKSPKEIERFKNQVLGVPDKALAEIKAFQPYHRGTSYKSHPLWRLNAMCNLDKHRRIPANGSELIVHFPRAAQPWVTVEAVDECHIVSVPFGHADKLQLDPSFSFKVNFGGGDPKIDPNSLVETKDGLWEMHNFIGDTVLPRFARFLA